jgi:hypothetical protein
MELGNLLTVETNALKSRMITWKNDRNWKIRTNKFIIENYSLRNVTVISNFGRMEKRKFQFWESFCYMTNPYCNEIQARNFTGTSHEPAQSLVLTSTKGCSSRDLLCNLGGFCIRFVEIFAKSN